MNSNLAFLNRLARAWLAGGFILGGLLFGSMFLPRLLAARPDPVISAWERARAAGWYRFSADLVQVTLPSATVTNVGRSSRTDEYHLEGRTDLRQSTLEMQIWSQGGSVLQNDSAIAVKVENGKTFVRQGAGEWQAESSFSTDGLAPQGDFMAYLQAVRDITAHPPETRAGVSFTRYSFQIDGPAFASYVRDQIEAAMRQEGELPPDVHFDLSPYYRDMTGDGELWVRSDTGLPLRQILNLDFPEQRDESVHARITVNFSQFGQSQAAPGVAGTLAALGALMPKHATLPALLFVVAFGVVLVRFNRSRQLQNALSLWLIASLVLGPLLSNLRTSAFLGVQAAKAAAQTEQRQQSDAVRALLAAEADPPFNPHVSPIKTAEQRARDQARLAASLPALHTGGPAAAWAESFKASDDGSDTDGDGLTDWQESAIGTEPRNADTDTDGLPDGVEAKGFEFPAGRGTLWYLNAQDADSNRDGIADGQECWRTLPTAATLPKDYPPCDLDSDGDGILDVFDDDNDTDKVPDRKDSSPFVASDAATPFSQSNPFRLTINNLTANKPTFVDFQIRPVNDKHLWFAFNVLDWPQGDGAGQVRDVDGGTYAGVAAAQGRTAQANESHGDMKLIPMLELRVPNSGANLPPQSDLIPYNISVNNFSADGSTKIVYVPLSIVSDEKTGARVAFSGRMRYLPTGPWPSAHEARLVWVTQVLNDVPCDDALEQAQRCVKHGYIQNVPQAVHTYYDDWALTGLSLREDHGADMAIVYEDPAVDANTKDDAALWALSQGLNDAFLMGRDQDGNGRRDVDASVIKGRFDRLSNAGVTDAQRWGLPNTLRVVLTNYTTFDQSVTFTAMTETLRILNTQFSAPWTADKGIKPLLMYASEQRSRALSLDAAGAANGGVSLTGSNLVLDLSPGGTPLDVNTVAGLKWTPYCAPSASTPTWSPCDGDLYWDELDRRYSAIAALPGETDPSLASSRMMATELYFLAMNQGSNHVVQLGPRLVSGIYTLATDSELEGTVRTGLGIGRAAVAFIANQIILTKYYDATTLTQALSDAWDLFKVLKQVGIGITVKAGLAELKASVSKLAKLPLKYYGAGALVVAAVGALAGGLLGGLPDNNLGAKILLKIVVVGIQVFTGVISPILQIKDMAQSLRALGGATTSRLLGSASELIGSSRAAGAIGAVIGIAITWGFFIYSMISNMVSAFSPEFNRGLAETIAATIYTILLTVLAATVIGAIIVAIIAFIDAILTTVCELGVDALRKVPGLGGSCFTLGNAAIKALAYALYNYDPMINTSRADLAVTGAPKFQLADPAKGFVAGNPISLTLPVTTTIVHKDPDPANGLLIYPYMWLYSPDNLRTSTFRYSLTSPDKQDIVVERNQMTSAWQDLREDHRYLVSPMYRGQANTTPSALGGISLPAGLNRAVPTFYLNMGYAIPAYECWGLLILGVCYTRELAGTNSTPMDAFRFDVFPPTLDDLMTLTNKNGGVGLAWDPAFPALKDADGDGLRARSQGGLDPGDSTWDADGDGLSDAYELERRQAGVAFDPTKCDTDADGLTDSQEAMLGTDPARADTDNDGLGDAEEVWHQVHDATCRQTDAWAGGWDVGIDSATPFSVRVSSNPRLADGDGDGISDLAERTLAQNPDPSKRLDGQDRPYHPNVINTSPIAVYARGNAGILGPGQSFVYTTTVVTTVALDPSPLDVIVPPTLGNSPATTMLNFDPATFNTTQTVTQPSALTVRPDAASQTATITSRVQGRVHNTGIITATGQLPVTVDADKPASTLDSLQDGQYLQGSSPGRPTTVIIGGTATDAQSGVAKVEVSVNGGPWQAADGASSWAFPLQVEDGGYTLQTRATDLAGNVETPGPGITVRADGSPPSFNFLNVPTQPIVPARTTDGRWTVTLGGFIYDPQIGQFSGNGTIYLGSGVEPQSVEVLVGRQGQPAGEGGWQQATLTGPTGIQRWSVNYVFPGTVADPTGAFEVWMRATDKVGHAWQDYSGSSSLRLDAAAPLASLSDADAARPVISDTLTINGLMTDTNSIVGLDKLDVAFAPIDQVAPLADAVLLLPLDERAGSVYFTDRSGQGNHAACASPPDCPTAGAPGRIDGALQFTGAAVVRVADAASLNFDATQSFSVQAWVKPTEGDGVILRKGRAQRSYRLAVRSNGVAAFDLQNETGPVQVSGGPDLRDNQWHHLVATVSRTSGRASLYIDGVLVGSQPAAGSFASTDELEIGGQTQVLGGPPIWMFGGLDQLAVFGHALSAAEVQAMYQLADRPWQPTSLVQHGQGVTNTLWSLVVPADLEGAYQIDLRGADLLGNRSVASNAWRGVVDTLAPRVVMTATATGASYFDTAINARRSAVAYVCAAQDEHLSEADFTCPGSSAPPTRSFDNDPILQSLFPDLAIRNRLATSYTLWEPPGQISRTMRACDLVGHCATATAQLTLNPAPAGEPQAVVVAPSDESIVASSGPVSVTVSAVAVQALKTITLKLDGRVVDTANFAQADAVAQNQRTVVVTPAGEGSHSLEAQAVDWNGATQTTLFPSGFTLDTRPPALTIDTTPLTVSDTYQLGSDILRFHGQASDTVGLASVQVRVGNLPWADAIFGGGTWRIAYHVPDPEGKNLPVIVRATDLAGRVTEVTQNVAVDFSTAIPPDTTLTDSPPSVSYGNTASFSFTGTPGERGIGGFECRLDGGDFVPCSSPWRLSGLSNGSHTFEARAIDSQGFVDPQPASYTWRVSLGTTLYLPLVQR